MTSLIMDCIFIRLYSIQIPTPLSNVANGPFLLGGVGAMIDWRPSLVVETSNSYWAITVSSSSYLHDMSYFIILICAFTASYVQAHIYNSSFFELVGIVWVIKNYVCMEVYVRFVHKFISILIQQRLGINITQTS